MEGGGLLHLKKLASSLGEKIVGPKRPI
jgi:hypothetical protein